MPFDVTALKIERVLNVLDSPLPEDSLLSALFSSLQRDPDDPETETKIWAVWGSFDDPDAEALMQRALKLFGSDDETTATELLDDVVARWPEWAEAWNKRATVRFMVDDFDGSLDDIAETLKREPRHFGALSGCGQICLQVGEYSAAERVLSAALAVHPGLKSVSDAVDALRRRRPDILN